MSLDVSDSKMSSGFTETCLSIYCMSKSPFSPYVLHAPPISLIWSLESEYINGQNNINDTDSRLQYMWCSHSHKLSLTHSSDTTELNGTRYNAGHKQFNELIISNDTTLIAVTHSLQLLPICYSVHQIRTSACKQKTHVQIPRGNSTRQQFD
jgi:hypothetical protein